MCLGIPGQIVAFLDETGHLAKVHASGVRRTIDAGLMLPDRLEAGDWVLNPVGFALSEIDREEARRTLDLRRKLDACKSSEVGT